MRCRSCDAQNPDSSRFCGQCGTPLVEPAPAVGARKTVTLVFSDVAGSTAAGEGRDPEAIREAMDRYFGLMRAVIERHGGFVEKFVGDAVMAAFGIPTAHEDDALRAVRAAVEMRDALERLNGELEDTWGISIAVRTGVNTGEVVVGDPAARETFATGDPVNTAARLEQSAGRNEILLGEATHHLVAHAVVAEVVDPLTLKGKTQPVPAWRLVAVRDDAQLRPGRSGVPLVGRASELMGIRDALDRVVSAGEPASSLIVAGPGVGKTALVTTLLEGLGDEAVVLQGHCLAYGAPALGPAAEMLRVAAGVEPSDAIVDVRGKLMSLVEGLTRAEATADLLASILGLGSSMSMEESAWAFRRALEAHAGGRLLVIVVEDLHWAAPALIDLLRELVARARAPVFLICTARPELLDEDDATEILPRAHVLRLEQLGTSDVADLVGRLLGDAAVDGSLTRAISARAGGNPLFIQEMIAMLIENGGLRVDRSRWVLDADLTLVPPTVAALISARLELLTNAERATAERAAVVGAVFERDQVAGIADDSLRPQIDDHLGSLTRREMVAPLRDRGLFRFGHTLVRDEVYRGLRKLTRADLHERLARWLVTAGGDRMGEIEETIGFHFEQAFHTLRQLRPENESMRGLAREAAHHLGRAGRNALDRSDVGSAVGLLRRASDLLRDEDPGYAEIATDLADALYYARAFSEGEAAARAARDASVSMGDESGEALARVLLARLESQRDEWGEGVVGEGRAMMPVLERHGNHRGLTWAWYLVYWGDWSSGRMGAVDEALGNAMLHAEAADDARARPEIAYAMATALLWGPTPTQQAIPRCVQLLALCGRTPVTQASVAVVLAGLRGLRGEVAEARQQFASARALLEDVGVFTGNLSQISAPYIEVFAGDLEEAERQLREDHDALQRMGERWHLSSTAALLARVAFRNGRLDDADRACVTSEELSTSDDVVNEALWRSVRALLMASEGVVDEADRLSAEATTLLRATDYLLPRAETLVDRAEVMRMADRRADASAALTEALELYVRKGCLPAAAEVRAGLADLAHH